MSVAGVVRSNSQRYIGWLSEACSIPSLAGQRADLDRCARWVADKLVSFGAEVRRLTEGDAPDALFATLGSGPRALLVYDHYDVQPVDPIALWDSDPFAPEIRDGRFFARGSADNKGDLVARLAALDVYREVYGELPLQVKFLVEGQEETGSEDFEAIVGSHADELAADGCIWEGHGVDFEGRPELAFGAKGLAYVELVYRGLAEDQHSSLAVTLPSPVWHVVEALATLRSPEGRILIDGFYDDVLPPGGPETRMLESLPFDEEAELTRAGAKAFVAGATGLALRKRHYFEPTCNIAGIVAGFTVPGASKTVLPKEAMVKLDLRLVPDQDPHDIVSKLRAHLDRHGFGDIEVIALGFEHSARSPVDSLIGRAATEACEGVFEAEPALAPMMVGTGPMYPIVHELGIPTVSPAGVHNPNSNIHAPNESCNVEDYLKTIEYTVAYLKRFAELEA